MNSTTKTMMALAVGVVIGVSIMAFWPVNSSHKDIAQSTTEKTPLYWVAPMDANYRRDKPGKSPMGMDLIPIYQQTSSADDAGVGAITISAQVINNLGVRTAPAKRTSMHTDIYTVGYVQYDQDNLVHIHPRVDGWIEKLYVKSAGDPVKKGQPLYTLYSPQLVNAQEELVIALKRKNTVLITAAKQRLAALQLPTAFISALEKTHTVKQNVTFFAPQSGVVDGLKIREGFYVKPGNTLMSIGQLDQVWAEAEVFERDAALIEIGLPVSMTLDYFPDSKWTGKVDYIYPTLNPKTRTLRLRLKFENSNSLLKPNMYAQVIIQAKDTRNSIVVPKESVIRTGKQDRLVLALGEGRFKSIAITIGRVGEQYIEVLEGLKEGEQVVTSAQFLLDSESSKSSDFRRMSETGTSNPDPQATNVQSATVNGVINHIDEDNDVLNISRDAIQKWRRPATTMDFYVADSIDLNALTVGMVVSFTFEVRDELVIVAISPQQPDSAGEAQ